MTASEQRRAADRDALLLALTQQVKADHRIEACWLFGSFGRGTQDAWSDLDVVLVIANDHFENFLSERYHQVSRLGSVVLQVESAHNGPPGGCYLMTGYDFPAGIQLVDWYWQPSQSAKFAKSEAVLVMNRQPPEYEACQAELVAMWQRPENDSKLALWAPTEDQDRANCAALAWAMLAIQAKNIARHPAETGLIYQDFIETLLARACGQDNNSHRFGDEMELTTPQARISRLQAIAQELNDSCPERNSAASGVGELLKSVKKHTEFQLEPRIDE